MRAFISGMTEKIAKAVKDLTELVAMVESAMTDVVQKTKRMDQAIKNNQKQLNLLAIKLTSLERRSSAQSEAFKKIDIITNQLEDLKTMVYETGLVVVGPDMIEKLEQKIQKRKAAKK